MALSRLYLNNLQHKVLSSSVSNSFSLGSGIRSLRTVPAALEKASEAKSDDRQVPIAVTEKSNLFPRRRRGRRGLWRNARELVPFHLNDMFHPSGLGNAFLQASENLHRLLQNLEPSRLLGRVKEDDKCYRLRFEVPGLSKEDLRIRIEDGYLTINGEHKEEEGSSDEDEWPSYSSYGYYNTSLLLPSDAKVEEIKAELKDGVLYLTIPRSEEQKKDVKEIEIK